MGKRLRTRPKLKSSAIELDIYQRELGRLSSTSFMHRIMASQDLVLRLDLNRKLEKHMGCVNTVGFNSNGEIIISGSDDRKIILWDWENGREKLKFDSGHGINVLQAKIMPYTNDHDIITSAANGQIRHSQIIEGGQVETKLLGKHIGRVHKLASELDNSHVFYSCGEDGLVQHFDLRTGAATELFYCKAINNCNNRPVARLSTMGVVPWNTYSIAVAGSDEYARLYDIRKYMPHGTSVNNYGQPTDYFCPRHLIGDKQVGISSLAFSNQRELLVSYHDENIYLFNKDMGLGPDPITKMGLLSNVSILSRNSPQVYFGHKNLVTVKGVSFFGPKSEYVVSGSDCGRIFIWKKKGGEIIRIMNGDKYVVNCVEAHPYDTVLASSGIEYDVKIWTPQPIERAILPSDGKRLRPAPWSD